ncbi:MAG: hypothetical protein ABI898_12940 [Sphingomonadales bacterium]
MPRSLLLLIVLVVIVTGVLFALSRIDPSKSPQRVEKVVPENALAK